MPPGKPVSLGAALLGAQPADGYAAPSAQVPDLFLVQLVSQHGSRQLFGNLFLTCRAGRDCVLKTAPQFNLTLALSDGRFGRGRKLAIERALRTRGQLPARVDLRFETTDFSVADCTWLFRSIARTSADVHWVVLDFDVLSSHYNGSTGCSKDSDKVLSSLGPLTHLTTLSLINWPHPFPSTLTLPQVTNLELERRGCALPPPNQLPNLRELGLYQTDYEGQNREYIPQLTALHMYQTEWQACARGNPEFLVGNGAANLTTLSISGVLDARLVAALLEDAPALAHLSVVCVDVRGSTYEEEEWGLKQLECTYDKVHEDTVDQMLCISRLPRSTHGPVVVKTKCLLLHCTTQGIASATVERFPEFEFKCDIMPLTFPTDATDAQLPLANQPTALGNALRQLRGLRAPGAVIRVGQHWASPDGIPPGHPSPAACREWTCGAIQAMSEALSDLQHLHIVAHVDFDWSDILIKRFVDHGPNIRHLWVQDLDSEQLTDDSADRVWPWDELTVGQFPYIDTLDITCIAALPHPAQSPAARRLRCNAVVELDDCVREVGVYNLVSRLKHLTWVAAGTRFTVQCHVKTESEQLASLQAQLEVLRAVRFVDTATERTARVCLDAWPLTLNLMGALQGLPHWCGTLDVLRFEWVLEPSEYKHLAQHVPVTYHKWVLGVKDVSEGEGGVSGGEGEGDAQSAEEQSATQLYEHIEGGMIVRREALGLSPVELV